MPGGVLVLENANTQKQAADIRTRTLAEGALELFRAKQSSPFNLTVIGLAATRFEDVVTEQRSLDSMLGQQLTVPAVNARPVVSYTVPKCDPTYDVEPKRSKQDPPAACVRREKHRTEFRKQNTCEM